MSCATWPRVPADYRRRQARVDDDVPEEELSVSLSADRSCGVISAPPGRFILPLPGAHCSTRYIINHLQSHFGMQYPLLNSSFSLLLFQGLRGTEV